MIRASLAFVFALALSACSVTPPKPETLDEGIDVQYGIVSILTSGAYSRYYQCRDKADGDFERGLCIDEGRDAHAVLQDFQKSLTSVDSLEDLDEGKLSRIRVLRAALAPHVIPGDRARLEVLDQ